MNYARTSITLLPFYSTNVQGKALYYFLDVFHGCGSSGIAFCVCMVFGMLCWQSSPSFPFSSRTNLKLYNVVVIYNIVELFIQYLNSFAPNVTIWCIILLLLNVERRHMVCNDVLLESWTMPHGAAKKIQLPILNDAIWCEFRRHFYWLFMYWWWRDYDEYLFQPIVKVLTLSAG